VLVALVALVALVERSRNQEPKPGAEGRSLCWLSVAETRSRRASPTHIGRGILSILLPLKMRGIGFENSFRLQNAIDAGNTKAMVGVLTTINRLHK
jgi:hypothetical protein